MNIPIYRAKKIDSDEYVEGYYSPDKNYQEHIHTIFYFDIGDFNVDRKTTTQIDPTTLAINFPDMLDSQGNKIFASLSASGKGGDIVSIYTSISKCDAIFYFDSETKSIKLLEKSKEKFSWEYGIVVDYENNPNKQIIGIEL